jgi:hypothetical protein
VLAAHALASSVTVAVSQGTAANSSIPYMPVPEAFPVEFASTKHNPPQAESTARSEQAVDHAKARRVGGLFGLAGDWLESVLVGPEPVGCSLTDAASGGNQRAVNQFNDPCLPSAFCPPPHRRPR